MNERFFELSEEKRMRIINAGFEVFSQNDYKHASTDLIAAKAGISKGLLFYYFHNKQELFHYLLDYCIKITEDYVLDEEFSKITDFFEIMEYGAKKKVQLIKELPYILNFSTNAYYNGTEYTQELFAQKMSADQKNKNYFQNVDLTKFKNPTDFQEILHMLMLLTEGYLQEKLRSNTPLCVPEMMKTFQSWSQILKRAVYKEEFLL